MRQQFFDMWSDLLSRRGGDDAVVFGALRATYREMDEASDRVAGTLADQRVGIHDIVPILLPRGIDCVAAMLGVMKAGAAFCIVNPAYPQERIAFIQKDTAAKLTVDPAFMASLPAWTGAADAPDVPPDAPATVVYTSGSTGTPKGVLLPQRALAQCVRSTAPVLKLGRSFLHIAQMGFIATPCLVLSALAVGTALYIASDEVIKDAHAILDYVRDHNIENMFAPPQMGRMLLEQADGLLKCMLVGSDRVRDLYSEKTKLINVYGASETYALVSQFVIDRPYSEATPIGFAPEGVQIHVLDEGLNPVAPGERGEICISGQVATGYINLPELTAERFVPNPFATCEDDAVLYKTNDLGYFRPEDGALVYVERKDFMLKVRGFRVEPGEIEAAMVKFAGVTQAVVTGFSNAAGETALYAVYVAPDQVDPLEVRDAIAEHLPDYMMPAFIEQLPALPLNANGKVDRKQLAPPDAARLRAPYIAPETDAQRAVCAAFEAVLGLERASLDDDFVLLGGDSMAAVRLQTALAEMALSAAEILELRTPRKIAGAKRSADRFLRHCPARERYPLTFAERAMVVEQMMEPESVAYNVRLAQRIAGPLDVQQLRGALAALVARHAVLRSHYVNEGGNTVHKVAASVDVALPVVRCAEADLESLIHSDNTPYDLAAAPLFRFALYEQGSDQHVLSLGFHHILIDGSCAGTLLSDLWALYQGSQLPELAVDFMDYAVWQSEQPDDEEGRAFFLDQFRDGVPETEMPTHPIRPAELPVADREATARLDFAPIERAAKLMNATPYQLLMAAAGLTLMKYTGTQDVVVGTAMSGRVLPETADMMGMFVNTVALRMKLDGAKDGATFVGAVSRLIRDAKAHQTYPFDQLVPILAPDRNASRGPVFDMVVNYLGRLPSFAPGAIEVEDYPVRTQELAHDLVLEMRSGHGALFLSLAYSDALYDGVVARNMLDQLCAIVERLCADARMPIGAICELPWAQTRQILSDFKGDVVVWNRDKAVADLLRAQAKETPDALAVVFKDTRLTYRELDELSDNLAAELARRGCGRGKTVGILIKRSEWMPVCAIGVLKSGSCYMPLDPSYPPDRLEYMLEDSGAEQLIFDDDLRELVSGYQGDGLSTSSIRSLPKPGDLPAPPAANDPMVLLYTSGTTGKPKGCTLTHANLVSYIGWHLRLHNITARDHVLCYASFGFDAHMFDMYPILTVGGAEYIIPEEMRLDLPGIDRYCAENDISFFFMTTQLGRQFAESHKSRTVRRIVVGGEALVPIAPPADLQVVNGYGPTEGTIMCAGQLVDRLYDRVPIGRAGDNIALYVVDKRDQLCPVGVAGELLIAGRQVGVGYLNRPDLTAEKFTANPFSNDPDYDRVYRTGDVVRFLPDGAIDFVGRRDFQVKIRGFRVELTEIESRIRQHPDVKDAAVVALDAPGGGKCAVAYVVGDAAIDVPTLNGFIEEALPPYMVPAATMQIEAIPLNPNGKVDRRKLPAPEYRTNESGESSPRPLNSLETRLAEIASGILGHRQFGLTDNLMRQGLTSLSSIKLIGQVDEAFGTSPTVREFMKDPTLLSLENAVLDKLLSGGAAKPEQTRQTFSQYPLSQSQLGVYLDAMKNPDALKYNVPLCCMLPAGTDLVKLKNALVQVVGNYPVLRCRIKNEGGAIVQIPGDAPVAVAESVLDAPAFRAHKAAFVRPFDLAAGPLYRAELIKTGEDAYMLLDFHHIAFDGSSMDLFMRLIDRAYCGEALPEERLSALSWAVIDAKREGTPEFEADKAFIAAELAGFEAASELPADLPHAGTVGSLREVVRPVDRAAVEARCRDWDVTPAGLFLAAVNLALGRWLSARELYIAAISSGRFDPKLQNSMGMFVATLPLALFRTNGQTCRAFAQATADAFRQAIDHEQYPFTRVAQDYGYEPSIMYTCELGVIADYSLGGGKLALEGLALSTPKFKLSVHVEERGSQTVFAVQYDDARYSAPLMEAFTQTLGMALQGLLDAKDDDQVSGLSLMAPAEKARIAGFNKTGEPAWDTLHAMFERAAAQYPDRTALIACDAELTYKDLNERANRIAHALLARGVKREDRVALLLKRTSRVLCAMLGVMKAGCAYIPLDPDYPQERIAHVLHDSKAHSMLTTAEFLGDHPDALDIDQIVRDQPDHNPDQAVDPGDLAYLIYTSGSTGVPKGVMIEHHGIANYCTAAPQNRHVYALAEHSTRMMSITTVAFDMFLKESMTSLLNGVSLVFAPEEATHDPARLAALFAQTGADAFNTTPSIMLEYTNHPGLLCAIAKCKVIMAGAEKYPELLLDRLLEAGSEALLFNTYGPTEISVSCNCKQFHGRGKVTVGAPLLGVYEQVVDADGNALPPLMVGELYIAGAGVARGYNDLPEQTAERFVMLDGRRAYRSGDLARWTLDGEIEILGRNDNQIKLRGLRIELGEIEAVLASLPGVRTSAVMIKKLNGQDHICAYYVAGNALDPTHVRDHLSKKLTGYMVPTAYKQIDKMPKTPGGKNDLRALPEPELLRLSEYRAPVGEKEQVICAIYQKVLDIDQVGADDSFFDIGGTSLQVTRVVIEAESAGLRDESGATLAYSDVFQHPTPAELAKMLSGGRTAEVAKQPEADYDYSAIHELLRENTLENLKNGAQLPPCDVLLTGVTGFLGIHVLSEMLRFLPPSVRVNCLVRAGRNLTAQRRLQNMAFFYFEDNFEDQLDSGRLRVVEGDMTDKASVEKLMELSFGMVINCAANVSHFARDSKTFDVNMLGVMNLIDLCMDKGARLIHVSTASVAGLHVGEGLTPDLMLTERSLYFGQSLENQYIFSKFIAERMILEACLKGLDAKIMRVGNLMARNRDGQFQINAHSNSFLGRMRAFAAVGCFPYAAFTQRTELAPIDSTAQAILLLSRTDPRCRVFHPYNNHTIFLGDLIKAFGDEVRPIQMVENEEFAAQLSSAMRDPARAEQLTSLIAYRNMANGKAVVPIPSDCEYTTQALLRQGWSWPETSSEYQRTFFAMMLE